MTERRSLECPLRKNQRECLKSAGGREAEIKRVKILVARDGIEPPTPAFSGCGSTVVIYIPTCVDGLHLRSLGSFVLQHSGTFEDGVAKVTLSVVPGSAVMVGSDSSMPERSTDPDRIFCVGNVAQTPQAGYIWITSASLRFGRSSYGKTSAAHGANLPPVLRRHQVVGTVPPS